MIKISQKVFNKLSLLGKNKYQEIIAEKYYNNNLTK